MPKLIKTMELLNYSPDTKGVCFGISAMAAQASFRKGHEVFANRIYRIQNYSEAQIETLKNKKKYLNERVELLCFFDGVSIYQGSTSVNSDFKSLVSVDQSLNDMPKLMISEMSEKDEVSEKDEALVYPEVKANLINAFTFQEFVAFIHAIKKHFDTQAFSIMLKHSIINHTTQIGFDGQKWLSTNNDSVEIGEDNPEDIKKVASNIFRIKRGDATEQMVVIIDILQPRGSKTDLTALKIHDFDLEKITDSFNKRTLTYLLSSYVKAARYDALLAAFDKIKSLTLTKTEKVELIEAKRLNGTTLLHWLANSNQLTVFNQILKLIDDFGLSPKTKINILSRKDMFSSSALFYAVKNKHEELVKLILTTCSLIKDEKMKANFLSAQNNEEVTALLMAAYLGNENIVHYLLKAILIIKDEEIQFGLLNACCSGTPALYMAANKKHEAIVRELLQAILSIQNTDTQYELLSAKHKNATPVLFQVTSQNEKSIAEILIKAYSCVQDEKSKANLLSAKNEQGMTALYKAAIEGCEEIVNMLLDAIILIKNAALKADLLSTKYLGKSALYIASENGYENIVKQLLKAIDTIEDKDSRINLLTTKDDQNCSAAFIAKAHGHKKIAKLLKNAVKQQRNTKNQINFCAVS